MHCFSQRVWWRVTNVKGCCSYIYIYILIAKFYLTYFPQILSCISISIFWLNYYGIKCEFYKLIYTLDMYLNEVPARSKQLSIWTLSPSGYRRLPSTCRHNVPPSMLPPVRLHRGDTGAQPNTGLDTLHEVCCWYPSYCHCNNTLLPPAMHLVGASWQNYL